jgi:purine catabolism regulator
MSLPLREVLAHPSPTNAEPVVLTGGAALERTVRWVHSSEVLEIAALLQGGELLLTGGVVLADATPAQRRRYVRELAGRGVTGVAIETGPQLPEIPPEVVAEAADLDFPVIELSRVVPFVAVTEAINGLLVNESVRRLRAADTLSHLLSAELTDGGGLRELIEVLTKTLTCRVAVLDTAGRSLHPVAQEPDDGGIESAADAISVPVTVHGNAIARLVVVPTAETDPTMLAAAMDRAPASLSLALARTSAVTPEHRAQRELLQRLRAGEPPSQRLDRLARIAQLTSADHAIGVVSHSTEDSTAMGDVETRLRRRGRRVLSGIIDNTLLALVVVPGATGAAARSALIADLESSRKPGRIRVGVGPLARGIDRFAHTLNEAADCLTVSADSTAPGPVVDAADMAVELLLRQIDSAAVLDDFVEDHLGPVLTLGPRKAATLIHTLEVYFRSGCSKTGTATELHLQRQALYQRLTRVFTLLGGDPAGTPRAAALHLAARIYCGEAGKPM